MSILIEITLKITLNMKALMKAELQKYLKFISNFCRNVQQCTALLGYFGSLPLPPQTFFPPVLIVHAI